MNPKNRFFVILLVLVLIQRVFSRLYLDDDSGSIEIPDRPEDRQAHKAQNPHLYQNPKNFLYLIAKLMNTVKNSIPITTNDFEDTITYRNAVHKTKKALCGLHRAYSYAEKAKRHFLRTLLNR